MKLDQIKAAVDQGIKVNWANAGYQVIKDHLGEYLIVWQPRSAEAGAIGLTHRDGVTLNGEECQFYPGVDNENLLAVVDSAGSEISASLALEDIALRPWRYVGFAAEDLNLEPTAPRYWVMVCSYLDVPEDEDVAVELAIDLLQEKGLINETVTASIVI